MKILHLEDDPWIARAAGEAMAGRGHEVVWSSTYVDALYRITSGEEYDAVVADHQVGDLQGRKGLDLLLSIEGPRRILFTAASVEVPMGIEFVDKMYPDRLLDLLDEVEL